MTLTIADPAVPLDEVRVRFCAFGLAERQSGTSWFYALPTAPDRPLLLLSPMGRGAQIYLYPQALGRVAGAAQWFYAALDDASFSFGSKLGPSISLPLDDCDRMALFWAGFNQLLAGDAPGRAATP